MEFKNKVVIITGASKGIGKAIALSFANEGAKIIINYHTSKKEANATVNEINQISQAIAIKCDVSNEIRVKKMFDSIIKKFGRVDILVNNAGAYIDGDEWNGSSKIWENTIKQNLISIMNTSKYASQIFQKQKNGIIINIASRFSISGQFDALAYAASKAGMISVTQAYAKLLTPFGRVNAISPWAVNAGYWLRAPKEELKETISKMPGKKLIEPKEIAQIAIYLASKKSSKVNGKNIIFDGVKQTIV
jgi:3-oxoacyl-[acyl-carrier protein] reductase